jgi:hypothetical protein
MTVKSLANMMQPGTVLAGGDCETCGKSGDAPKVVTRVAMANIEKLNKPVSKAAPEAQKVEAEPKAEQPAKRTLLSQNKPEAAK